APRGVPQIEVTFDIDANGILNVSAKDLGTGKEKKIRIESSSGLSQAEVERMRKDAEANAEADHKKRELIDARNHADQMVYQIERLLKENGDKITDDSRKPIQAAVEKVKQAASKDDATAIRQAISELESASHAMAQHLYSRGGQGPGAGGGPTGGPSAGPRP